MLKGRVRERFGRLLNRVGVPGVSRRRHSRQGNRPDGVGAVDDLFVRISVEGRELFDRVAGAWTAPAPDPNQLTVGDRVQLQINAARSGRHWRAHRHVMGRVFLSYARAVPTGEEQAGAQIIAPAYVYPDAA